VALQLDHHQDLEYQEIILYLELQRQLVEEEEVIVIGVFLMDHLVEILEDLEVAVMDLIVPGLAALEFNHHNH
jgi:hypothetical protein